MEQITLLTGCFIFGEGQGQEDNKTFISEVYDVFKFNSIEDANDFGEEYLNGGGDSYLILDTYSPDNLSWDKEALNNFKVCNIITILKDMDIDGETMEYIITKVGMFDQMKRQLEHQEFKYISK